jgi:rubrerythrin
MEHDQAQSNTSPATGKAPESPCLARRAFLAETLGASAAISILLMDSEALAQPKGEQAPSLADRIQSQFREEAVVAAKYAAFAVQAKAEGRPNITRLFQALVLAETYHAEWLLRLSNGVISTSDNIKASAELEALLASKTLPEDAAVAKHDKNVKAEELFDKLTGACGQHEKVLRRALTDASTGKDMDAVSVRVCPQCGNVIVGDAPDRCPVCGSPGAKFIEFA